MEIDRNFFYELTNLGISYSSLGKYDQAIQMYQEAIKQDPESLDAQTVE